MSAYAELYMDQGATFNAIITLADDLNNQYVNISSYVIRSQMRRSYYSANASANLTCTITDANSGQMLISLTAGETANIKAGRYVFDVTAITPSNTVNRLLEGLITVSPGTTR